MNEFKCITKGWRGLLSLNLSIRNEAKPKSEKGTGKNQVAGKCHNNNNNNNVELLQTGQTVLLHYFVLVHTLGSQSAIVYKHF